MQINLFRFCFILAFVVSSGCRESALSAQNNSFDEMLKGLLRFSVPVIQPAELEQALAADSTLILIDARPENEFKVSHIKGALCLKCSKAESLLQELNRKKKNPVVIYCSVGYRSEKMAETFVKAGFTNVKNLYGGIFLWNNEGRKIVDSGEKETVKIHPYNSSWGKWITRGEKTY